MKKINKLFTMLVIALAGLSLAACNEGDDLSTDQYGNEIKLNAFGPCPVLRGGTLYFYGSNLDQVSEIDLPGADPITAIEVLQSGKESKISIAVPAEKCDTGKVVLKTLKGGTITSVSPVTYREDIELKNFFVKTEGNLVGSVGETLSIRGDYLNLIHGVIFADNDTIKEEQFINHDRYSIDVIIPAEAKTGTIKLTDLAKEPLELESKEALIINLPEVEGLSAETIKAGQTLTVTGASLDQIASIELTGATIEAADFKSQTSDAISFVVSSKATDGEVNLITKSGVSVSAGNITTVVPTDLAVAPAPVKNGAEITITGKDLDLVTGIAFPNADGADAKLKVTATKVTATVPEEAQEGDITLSLDNGKTVTVAYTLVKPTVTACTPAAITAGEKVIIKGTDLDLVASVTFPGDEPQTVDKFTAQNANAIALEVPAACVGTGFTFTLKNGTIVEVKEGLTINAASDPALSQPSFKGTMGKEATIEGKNFNNVEAIYIGENKVTKFKSRSNTAITFTVPSIAQGEYDLILVSADGTKYDVGKFNVLPQEINLWTGKVGPTNWSGDKTVNLTEEMKAEIKPGMTLGLDIERDDSQTYWQIEVCGSWWTGLPCFQKAYAGGDRAIIDVAGYDQISATLEQADIDILNAQGAFLFVGNGVYVTRIFLK